MKTNTCLTTRVQRTEALLSGLVESVSGAAAHAASTRERSNRVLTGLTLNARVLIQRALVNVYVTHT